MMSDIDTEQYPCIYCNKDVKKNEKAIQCTYCDYWAHQRCKGMPKDQFDMLYSKKCRGMFWACRSCTSFAEKHRAETLLFKQRLEALEKKTEEIDEVSASVEELKKDVEEMKSTQSNSESSSTVFAEIRDRDSRKDNLVIYDLPEPAGDNSRDRIENDREQFCNLMSSIDVTVNVDNDVKFMKRLGKYVNERKRPLLVGISSQNVKESILQNAPKLASQHGTTSQINITRDLTKMQRDEESKMKRDAEARNAQLSEADKKNFQWKVIGRRGERRMVKSRIEQTGTGQGAQGRGGRPQPAAHPRGGGGAGRARGGRR